MELRVESEVSQTAAIGSCESCRNLSRRRGGEKSCSAVVVRARIDPCVGAVPAARDAHWRAPDSQRHGVLAGALQMYMEHVCERERDTVVGCRGVDLLQEYLELCFELCLERLPLLERQVADGHVLRLSANVRKAG